MKKKVEKGKVKKKKGGKVNLEEDITWNGEFTICPGLRCMSLIFLHAKVL